MKAQNRVAIYARVSTNDGRQSIENQTAELREFAHRAGWPIVEEFIDHASGSSTDRPAFQKMLAAARRRRFDTLLVWSLDRLTREGTVKALQLIQDLRSAGVTLHSYTEPFFQFTGPLRDALIGLIAALAEYERDLIRSRIAAGMRRAKEENIHCGRSKNEKARKIVHRLKAKGASLTTMAARAHVSRATVCRILKEEKEAA